MGFAVGPERFDRCLGAIYDATVSPAGWQVAMADVAALFDAQFADICAWTPDRKHVSGLAHGLCPRDYEEVFLGFWFNRNVWSKQKPVRIAGEVVSTRQMVAREDLRRSAIYRDYLHERGLHEGLRLSLWVDAEGLADVSVLRPWSMGAFGSAEVELGRALLPHLQRAATVTRRLHQAAFDLALPDGGTVAAVAIDAGGAAFWFNEAAQQMIGRGLPLRLVGDALAAATAEATAAVRAAVAGAIGMAGVPRRAGSVRLPGAEGAATLVVQPLSENRTWSMPRGPAALALLRSPRADPVPAETLRQLFGLTATEAQLALDLLDGLSVDAVSRRTGRSRNTTRSHLARLMEKTGTSRQADLVRVLGEVGFLCQASRREAPWDGATGWLTARRQ